MVRTLGLTCVWAMVQLTAGSAAAQQPPFYYPEPPDSAVQVTRDVRFATADTVALAMDVYRPAGKAAPSPALIFYTMYWPESGPPARGTNAWWDRWARIAAANGVVAILPDIRAAAGTGNATTPSRARGDDFQRLVAHLQEHAPEFGIDRDRLAVFAASGAVAPALPAVEDPRQTAVSAAVMYYGGAGAKVPAFRLDLPVLYVRAGLDSRGMNAAIDSLVAAAISQNAPVTVMNYHTGHHAFEGRDDNATTRQIIDLTIEFVKRATAPESRAATRDGYLGAVVAGHMSAGNFRQASSSFAELASGLPDRDAPAIVQLAATIVNADSSREGRQQVMRVLLGITARNPANLAALYQVGKIGALTGAALPRRRAPSSFTFAHSPGRATRALQTPTSGSERCWSINPTFLELSQPIDVRSRSRQDMPAPCKRSHAFSAPKRQSQSASTGNTPEIGWRYARRKWRSPSCSAPAVRWVRRKASRQATLIRQLRSLIE